MIAHRYKCIFVHIPKVAGQSIEKFFLDLYGLDWKSREPLLLRRNEHESKGPPRLAHLKLHEYVAYHYLSEELFDSYFKFAFVRNPWDRAVSFYKYGSFYEELTFKEFVENELPGLIAEESWFYGAQYDFIYQDGKTQIDFIGRYEKLQEDFSKVCDILGIPFTDLPFRNKSMMEDKAPYEEDKRIKSKKKRSMAGSKDQNHHSSFLEFYDDHLIQTIAELYDDDVKAFNYAFSRI